MYKEAAVSSVLMKVYSISFYDRGYMNVMLVLQSCTDSMQVMADLSPETYPTLPDGTYDINVKVEDLDIKEEEEVNVKTEKEIGSEEEECVDIKDEDFIYSEEEKEEKDLDTQEEEDVEIKEEVS
jgi:hypothetical protein